MTVRLMHSEELAEALGYSQPHGSFRAFLKAMNITPVPGRAGYYDPELVRHRLNEAQGIGNAVKEAPEGSPVEERRRRRGG